MAVCEWAIVSRLRSVALVTTPLSSPLSGLTIHSIEIELEDLTQQTSLDPKRPPQAPLGSHPRNDASNRSISIDLSTPQEKEDPVQSLVKIGVSCFLESENSAVPCYF
jgi:hypothetical protein